MEGLKKVGFEYIKHQVIKKGNLKTKCRFCEKEILKRKIRIRGALLKFEHKTITIWSCTSCWAKLGSKLKEGFKKTSNPVRFIQDSK